MRRLIFSDIHNDTDSVDRLLDKETFDEAICAGDYFHNFYDDAEKNRRTAKWLANQKFIKLLGNHDGCHRWPGHFVTECPGWTPAKQEAIDKHISKAQWDEFKLFYWVDGYLISHAGIHPAFGHPIHGITPDHMAALETDALQRLENRQWAHLLGWGLDRGSNRQDFGGITWMDWSSLKPIDGLNQIVGHTPGLLPKSRHTATSKNYCIDTHRAFYAVLEDGEVEIKAWPKKPKTNHSRRRS